MQWKCKHLPIWTAEYRYKLHTGMGRQNPFTIHAYSGLPGICYSWQRNLSCIPIHHPCIQWITRHLLLLTAESVLHSPTSSMHTVDLEAYCYFILWLLHGPSCMLWPIIHSLPPYPDASSTTSPTVCSECTSSTDELRPKGTTPGGSSDQQHFQHTTS